MRLAHVDAVPHAYDTAWNELCEPDAGVGQVLALVAGAGVCTATLVAWLLAAPFNPVRIDYTTLVVAVVIVLVLHELAHAWTFASDRGRTVRIERRQRKIALRYEGTLSRNHYLAVLIAPFVVVSLLPVAVSSIASIGSGDVVLISMLNALVSGGDVIAALLVAQQVPEGATIRRQGSLVLWKPLPDRRR